MGWVEDGEVEGQEGDKTGISMLNKIVLKTYFKITKKKNKTGKPGEESPQFQHGSYLQVMHGAETQFL